MTARVEELHVRLAQIDKNKEEIRGRISRVFMAINMLPSGDPQRMYPILDQEVADLIQQHREQIAAGWWAHYELTRLENRFKK
jgi:hypothetical protein